MKKLSLLLAGFALVADAQATVYQYDFTATIQEMVEFSPMTLSGGAVSSSSLTGNLVSVGAVVHGHFSYDTDTAQFSNFGGTALYAAPGALNTIGATIGGNDIGLLNPNYNSTNVQVSNNAAVLKGADGFGVSNLSSNAAASQMMALSFLDKSGTALGSAALPSALDFNQFSGASFYYVYTSNTTHAVAGANGMLTSLTQVTAVPEPETYAMLLAGLGLVGWSVRRKKQA
jgi:hypothetical protein